MLGLGIMAGTYNREVMHFSIFQSQTQGSMLLMVLGSLLIEAVFVKVYPSADVAICYSLAIILLVFYGSVLLFVFKSHTAYLSEVSPRVPTRNSAGRVPRAKVMLARSALVMFAGAGPVAEPSVYDVDDGEEDDEIPQLSPLLTLAALVIMTTLVTFHTEFVSSVISDFMTMANVSPAFTGIVLLPFLSNDTITITAAAKDQIDISIAYTFGKCAQIGLAIFPFCVILGWIIGVELIWDFNLSEVALLCTTALLAQRIVSSGVVLW